MVEVKKAFGTLNIAQVLSLTQCLDSQECHGCASIVQLNNYIFKIKTFNIIHSIKNSQCFIHLRRKAQNKLYLGIEHLKYFRHHFGKKYSIK